MGSPKIDRNQARSDAHTCCSTKGEKLLRAKRPIFQYVILILLFATTLLYRVRYTADILRGEKIDYPLVLTKSASNVVGFANAAAMRSGIRPGDQLLTVNGVPYIGSGVLGQALALTPVGGQVQLEVRPRDGTPADKRMVLLPIRQAQTTFWQVSGDLALNFLLPVACVLLGFSVAFLRPRDPMAWLLLAVMLSFPHILETYKIQGWAGGWGQAAMLYHAGLAAFFPIVMFLFGRFFPEPFPAGILDRAWRIQQWAIALPVAILAVGSAIVQAGELRNYGRVAPLSQLLRPFSSVAQILVFWLIGSFFAALAIKGGMSASSDAKRRLRIVYWGATVAFSPALLLTVLPPLLLHKSPEDLLPQWVIVLALIPLMIFPLTLAYVIAVHKAMGVSVVVRQSLQYALATRGVRGMEVAVVSGLAVVAVEILGGLHHSRMQRLAVVLFGGIAVLSTRRLADRLRVWIDGNFFREAYNAEYVLTELSDQVRTIVETSTLVETVITRIAETLHVSQVLVLLRSGNVYQTAYALGFADTPEVAFLPSMGTADLLRKKKEPARVYWNDKDSWLYQESNVDAEERAKLARLKTELLVPLLARDNLLGFISLGPKKSEEPYTGSDLRMLKSVAAQTGLALENASLVQEVAAGVALRERANREVEIAREVQERLFPQELPRISGLDYLGYCRPALAVGGDYYDFLALPEGQLGLAIGDVSGKGIAAALMMASLQASLRGEIARAPTDLAAVMSNINRLVYELSSSNRYATFFYGQYDPADHMFRYVNAGHNPPMVFHSGTAREVARLETGGTVIGLLPNVSYEQGAILLVPGDVLVAFTDGISEAMDAQDEEWGEDRMMEVTKRFCELNAKDVMDSVLKAADAFVAGAKQHDDMTLVVMQVKE